MTITTTLDPDNLATELAPTLVLSPGESATYSAAWVAGTTQRVFFEKSTAPASHWETVASALFSAGDGTQDFSGTIKNTTTKLLHVRFRGVATTSATNNEATGVVASVSETNVPDEGSFGVDIPADAAAPARLSPVVSSFESLAAASDPAGALLAYFEAKNAGDATGGADVDDDVSLIKITGHTIGNGNLVMAAASEIALAAFTHGIRINIGGTLYYIPISTTAPSGW